MLKIEHTTSTLWLGRVQRFAYCLGQCSMIMKLFVENPRADRALKGQLIQAPSPPSQVVFLPITRPHSLVVAQLKRQEIFPYIK